MYWIFETVFNKTDKKKVLDMPKKKGGRQTSNSTSARYLGARPPRVYMKMS